ncbi:cobalamin biosynthesis protein [Candidatus Magnetominusculus dajiuhuensis]|uniref:cobalamin biosynthesis protein n=1 Tax=Candidatus Magnetominusculus dajiuhuensis TaxID=3137712 RepID=UPI003B430E61
MTQKKLWIGLAVMALLVPLGIIVPEKLGAAGAWGEWSAGTLNQMLGYLPEGLQHYTDLWKAPIGDYTVVPASANVFVKSLSYIVSGLIGAALAGLGIFIISRFAARPEKNEK